MKFHWGHGIALFYTFFAATLVWVVIRSRDFDNSLVYDNYYQHDIEYQQHKDRLANSRRLTNAVSLEKQEDGRYFLQFPIDELSADPNGELQYYRPSSNGHDRFEELAVDAKGIHQLQVEDLLPGRWTIKASWQSGGRGYYDEFDIYLPAK